MPPSTRNPFHGLVGSTNKVLHVDEWIPRHKLGMWQFEYIESNKNIQQFDDKDYQEIVDHCEQATQINP